MTYNRLLLIVAVLLLVSGCSRPTAARPRVTKVLPPPILPRFEAVEAGRLPFRHDNGSSGRFYYPEIVGPGCGLFDFDSDGWLDLFLVQGGALPGARSRAPLTNRLFRNLRNGSFAEVTARAGVGGVVAGVKSYGLGCATGDFDGDGHADLLVTNFGRCQLYRNRGDGRFEEVAARAGLTRSGFWTSATFLDFDRDGRLDLFICNYIQYRLGDDVLCGKDLRERDYCPPGYFPPTTSALYRNRGNGTFEDVTRRAGVTSPFNKALGVVASDFNRDGWPDLYVACDLTPNLLYLNQRNGTFRECALERGVAVSEAGEPQASMGVDARDSDGDGKFELFVTNYWMENNNLFRPQGDGFTDESYAAGLAQPSLPKVGWGAALRDFNNDGWLDCFVANGHVLMKPEFTTPGAATRQSNQVFVNLGRGNFRDVSASSGPDFARRRMARGAAFGDVDNDGRLDVLVANNHDAPVLLMNRTPRAGHWLQLQLIGSRSNRSALGARVTVSLPDRTLVDEVRTSYSFASANDHRLHFGLGAATVARLVITWPSGQRQTLSNLSADQCITVREP